MRYPVIFFDLFRTVITLAPEAPTGQVRDPTWRSAMRVLRGPLARMLPAVEFETFLDALIAASEEVALRRPPEYYEVPIADRYRRALSRLGWDGPDGTTAAEQLSRLQLGAQMENARLLPRDADLLHELAARRKLGLVSNFDDGASVRQLLAREGLEQVLAAIVISFEFGRRKPHPAIFHEALRQLSVTPANALFVGDSPGDDVAGARGAGMDVAWLNAAARDLPPAVPEPTYVLSKLTDLRSILGGGE